MIENAQKLRDLATRIEAMQEKVESTNTKVDDVAFKGMGIALEAALSVANSSMDTLDWTISKFLK